MLFKKVFKRSLKFPFYVTLHASVAGVLVKDAYTVKDIHVSVHRNIIPSYSQRDAIFIVYLFLQTLYMFQAVPPPIIRST